MKIAVFQMSAAGDAAQNPDRIIAAMHEAADNGADLLVAPELAMSGYGRGDILSSLAQPANGDWARQLQKSVTEIGISLVTGFPERDGETQYISALIINKNDAQTPLIYRKGTLYGRYEKALFQANRPSVVMTELNGIKTGFLICYDAEFPENMRRLAQSGADLVIVPTALPLGKAGAFVAKHVIPVRAFENQIFIAYANHADADAHFAYQGLSCIAAPNGEILAQAPVTGSALIYADIEPPTYAQSRLENPYLADLAAIK